MKVVGPASDAGEAHRVELNKARELADSLEEAVESAGGDEGLSAFSIELTALRDRLSKQLRAAKVLRAYQRRVLLGRTCGSVGG